MNNTILSNLSIEDKNKSFVTIHKDGAYFNMKLSDILFNSLNTATGTDTVTLNKRSGIVNFNTTCDLAPSKTDYIIINNLINSSSIVRVNVQSQIENTFTTLINVVCLDTGIILISINDGETTQPGKPIITFEILN